MKFAWLRRWLRSINASIDVLRQGLLHSFIGNIRDTETPVQATPQLVFRLNYKNDEIGTLEFSETKWRFTYSNWFKNQSVIKPFANFPDVNREYISDDLPPFFESRLPGISQPQVEAFLKDTSQVSEGETKAALLKQFGRRTITNPFELAPAF